jgi:hypothetical protein
MRTWPKPAGPATAKTTPVRAGQRWRTPTVLDLHRGWRWVGWRMPPLIEVLDERWNLPASGPSLERPLTPLMSIRRARTARQRRPRLLHDRAL